MGDPEAPGPSRPVIYTIGHSDRTADDLAALLDEAGVTLIVDVRSAPWSRRHPWHGKSELETRALADGRRYSWMGASLGGHWPEGFPVHRETESYKTGIEQVASVARHERVVLLCAERDPAHCHRRFLADDLAREGFIVLHIVDPGWIAPHQTPLL